MFVTSTTHPGIFWIWNWRFISKNDPKMAINWMSMDYFKSQIVFFRFPSIHHLLLSDTTFEALTPPRLSRSSFSRCWCWCWCFFLSLKLEYLPQYNQPFSRRQLFAVRGIYSLLCHGVCLKLSSKKSKTIHTYNRVYFLSNAYLCIYNIIIILYFRFVFVLKLVVKP